MRLALDIGMNGKAGEGGGSSDPVAGVIALMDSNAGQHSFHDYTEDATFPAQDASANNNDHASTSFRAATLDGTLGAVFPDSSTRMEQIITGGTFTIAMAATRDAASTAGNLGSDNGNTGYGAYSSANTGTIIGTVLVGADADNLAAVTTPLELYNALTADTEVIVMMQGLDLSARTRLDIGRGSAALVGSVRRVAVIEEGAMGGDLTEARTLAAQAVAAT